TSRPHPQSTLFPYTTLFRSIREGISRDGRTLFPIMPYQHFRSMPDEDLASVIVYLRSLKPVSNRMPGTAVPFPLSRLINGVPARSEEHTSELQSQSNLVCRL